MKKFSLHIDYIKRHQVINPFVVIDYIGPGGNPSGDTEYGPGPKVQVNGV
jgi:hypothetical protein